MLVQVQELLLVGAEVLEDGLLSDNASHGDNRCNKLVTVEVNVDSVDDVCMCGTAASRAFNLLEAIDDLL